MARRSHLEERIMTMLNRKNHRRVGLRILLPTAVLMAAMVPAIAAVSPGDPPPRHASPELKDAVVQLKAAENRLEPQLEKLEALEIEIDPEIEINQQSIEEIEDRMEPYLKQMEQIEVDMEPYNKRLAELEDGLENLVLHMEDGTLEDIERQIGEQMAEHMETFEAIDAEMEPLHEQLQQIQQQMEPLHRELERVHIDMKPAHRELERLHDHMDEVRRGMEPLQEELELLGDRFDAALRAEVANVLEEHLGPVTTFDAPFDEAAARIVEQSHIHMTDDIVKLQASRREVRETLTNLMKPHMTGLEEAFDAAVDNASGALTPLEISIE
jgi:chromosome segregation ATPase